MIRKVIIFALIILLLLAVSFVIKSKNLQDNKKISIVEPQPANTLPSVASDTVSDGWNLYIDVGQKAIFKYPQNLQTQYVRTQNWPPTISVSSDSLVCKESEQIPGEPFVVKKVIGGVTYCIQNMTQGAAGSLYSDYTYSFMRSSTQVKLQFTLVYPQCGNYPSPQKSACEIERQQFDLDTLINNIAQTVILQANGIQNIKLGNSPVKVQGVVPSGWMFEGAFPVEVLDANRKVIANVQGKEEIPGTWTSSGNIAFNATIVYSTNAKSGFLVLEKDNPSGLPSKAASFEIPISF